MLMRPAIFFALFTFVLTACDDGGSKGPSSFMVITNTTIGGSITPSNTQVAPGETTSFTIIPDPGFSIVNASGCNGTLLGNTYSTGAATTDCRINITFTDAVSTPILSFSQVKTFQFTWADVADATHYKLLENHDGESGFSQVGDDIPADVEIVDHVVPLYARLSAEYILQSCFTSGCNDSPSIAVSGSLVDSIGYFKASNPDAHDNFGISVSLSGDGKTLAVGATGEDSNTTGIDGAQSNELNNNSGAVYVFRRSESRWGQQAYIKASNADEWDEFGESVSLSADGNTLAVGTFREGSNAAGINGDQSNNDMTWSGAVYVFSYSDGTWRQQAYIKASNTDEWDEFGGSLSLSGDGNTLAVGAFGEDSNATGINGNQSNNDMSDSGAAYVFSRSGSTWSQQAYIKASNSGPGDQFARSISLSADGNSLAVGALGEKSNALGINGDQNNNDMNRSGAAYVFNRSGSTWSQQAYIKASNTDEWDEFGGSLSLSADGNTLAIGASREDSNTTGINGNQSNNDMSSSGAAYVFSRSGSTWSQQTYIKASNADRWDVFGGSLSLSADGNALAVGAVNEGSSATGLEGDQSDNSYNQSGAVYMFKRIGNAWRQEAYLKASNTDNPPSRWDASCNSCNQLVYGEEWLGGSNYVGGGISLSGDGKTLAASAVGEDSSSSGIGGDQSNNAVINSGAVYMY